MSGPISFPGFDPDAKTQWIMPTQVASFHIVSRGTHDCKTVYGTRIVFVGGSEVCVAENPEIVATRIARVLRGDEV